MDLSDIVGMVIKLFSKIKTKGTNIHYIYLFTSNKKLKLIQIL